MSQEYCQTIYQAVISNYENLFADGCIYHGREGLLAWKYEGGQASISLKQMAPDWEVRLGNRVALDYLQVVDSLWFLEGGNEIDQKRKGTPQVLPHG